MSGAKFHGSFVTNEAWSVRLLPQDSMSLTNPGFSAEEQRPEREAMMSSSKSTVLFLTMVGTPLVPVSIDSREETAVANYGKYEN
jgi:hypothetical protein